MIKMSSSFDFNAPQYIDFKTGLDDSDGADQFFDVETEEPVRSNDDKENISSHTIKMDRTSSPLDVANYLMKKENSTPLAENINLTVVKTGKGDKSVSSNMKKREMLKGVRRLSEVNNKTAKEEISKAAAEKLSDQFKAKKRIHFDGIPIDIEEERKEHTMTTRMDELKRTPKLELRSRVVNKSKDLLETRKRKSLFNVESDSVGKYVAMAEKIMHFQRDTPPRFHTSKRRSFGNNNTNLKNRQSYNPRRTIALTPKLMTSLRTRPVEVLSHEEREEEELKEIQKYKIKANPLNDKIFKSPRLPPKSEKLPTVQEPFHLTEVFKKPAPVPANEPFKFTAKPVPKTILEKPVGVGRKSEMPVTVPQSPAITKSIRYQKPVRVPAISNDNYRRSENVNSFGIPLPFNNNSQRSTEVKPFSFEVRDKQMLEKKEKKIQEIFLEEKRAREFKANPAPNFVPPKERNRSTRSFHLDCSKSSITSVNEEAHRSFKARSPKVLRKAPFEPKLDHTHSQPLDIKLWTERRLQERQEFELKQAEMEMQQAILREQMMLDKKLKEDEEIAKLRQEAVHKAQPMPKFKPPPQLRQSTMPLTDPKSPRFSKRFKSNK